MKTIKSFINANRVRMSVEWADSNPNMTDWKDANHFKVRLRMGRKSLTTYFSQGYGINGEPAVDDVLDCLASDASGVENARSFEEWASEYGYDTDSRKAEKTFKTIEKQAEKLRNLLGSDLYEELLWNTERQ